jgi:hypothetical protein
LGVIYWHRNTTPLIFYWNFKKIDPQAWRHFLHFSPFLESL